ncbi:MAG: hypothetical protein ACRD6W_01045, partial [Nitrososphaerales archaeon]
MPEGLTATTNPEPRLSETLGEEGAIVTPGKESNSSQVAREYTAKEAAFSCAIVPNSGGDAVECTFDGELSPYEELIMNIRVAVSAKTASTPLANAERACKEEKVLCNSVTVTGGEAKEATLQRPLKVNDESTRFGVEAYEVVAENQEFAPDTQAGAHPFQLTTTLALNQVYEWQYQNGGPLRRDPQSPDLPKDLSFRLPAGLIGNVNAVPECSAVDFGAQVASGTDGCSSETAVGVVSVTFNDPPSLLHNTFVVPVFNLAPEPGEPARFGFDIDHVPVAIDTSVRTGEDYGVTVSVQNTSEAVQVLATRLTIWGIAGDRLHDQSRGWTCLKAGNEAFREHHPCEA